MSMLESEFGKIRIYVGTRSIAETHIYSLGLDVKTGLLSPAGEPKRSVNPSFLAIHPNGSTLYAVNEIGRVPSEYGYVSAFAIHRTTGVLEYRSQCSSGGAAPCYLSVDPDGRYLFVANYWGGSVSVIEIVPDGRLGPVTAFVRHHQKTTDPSRDPGAHAHAIRLDAKRRFAIVADMGRDELVTYGFDPEDGSLTASGQAFAAAPGAGPRHFVFHDNNRYAYLINELNSTATALAYNDETGSFREIQTISTLPHDVQGKNAAAEIALSPDSKVLYASNRGHDSLAIFDIDADTGRLSPNGHQSTLGNTPRHFAIEPLGRFLIVANQDSDAIVVFKIEATPGRLTPVGPAYHIPQPMCVTTAASQN